ncbi:O-antigen ligase like membrane protein [Desulfopila aestuarii DSM 18488]|uniref:O-antigen ligase like membrane protein n=2 Tax=Desulfopila aestuarii TaxID=231440 RepID=A0A1M7YG15_9BACT|nr:O-antigen ligase like membrane protein [Desulfopila aestuarii DSM 18488]
MPKTIMGVQGLNPWNILLFIILISWLSQRKQENLSLDIPRNIKYLLKLYLLITLVSSFRMLGDITNFNQNLISIGRESVSLGSLVSEHFINSFKWVLPGLLLFDGCRDRKRLYMGILSISLVYFLLALQVIKYMPIETISGGGDLSRRGLKILTNEIGFHRVNLSMMFAGASWAIFSCRQFIGRRYNIFVLTACLLIIFAQALTGGRMGYLTWAVIGCVLLWYRWRRYLLLAPIVAASILIFVPGTLDRINQGFGNDAKARDYSIYEEAYTLNNGSDLYTITSGRNIAWPLVIDKIKEAPIFGYGKEAMIRTGLTGFLLHTYSETFPHPHNAYLQLLLDTGFVGALFILPFYLVVLKYSVSLFRDNRQLEFIASGGFCLALTLALLVASLGSQTFYPREGAVGMWCAIGLMLRIYVQRLQLPPHNNITVENSYDDLLWR